MGLFCFVSFAYGFVVGIRGDIPQLDPVRQAKHLQKDGIIYDSTGHRVLARLVGSESRKIIPSDEIGPVMKQAIVAIEDKRFFEHRGVDVRGIVRAVWQDVQNKKVVQGGSTITQQFVKNAYLTSKRSISRKLKEAALSWQLDQVWSKDRILTAYLNTIYFGNGAYGIERAAQVYFGHGASKLTTAEAALLAGIPADPSRFNPVTDPKAAHQRRREVLQAMVDQKDITYNEFRKANRTPLPKPEDIHQPGVRGPAQYFVDYVKQQLVDRYGTRKVFGGGLVVKTTIDLALQQRARNAISKWLHGPNMPTAALVALDPRNGRVLAMVGGQNYRQSQFNLAVQGERQPGSSFKPFVLTAALDQGISPSTTLESRPVTIALGDRNWYVHNYEGSNLGWIDLTSATAYSDNTVYAQLTNIVQPRNVAATARELGVTRKLNPYFAIGLGADPVSPLEMARAFAAFADGGKRIDGSLLKNRPRVVLSVNGADNKVKPRQVISQTNAEIVTDILQKVVQYGTGKRAALADRPVAGKTGTTENYGDAWFVGYTPQMVVAVWVGYPNTLRPMLTEFHGDPVAGGTYPALIWKSFMESALRYKNAGPAELPGAEHAGKRDQAAGTARRHVPARQRALPQHDLRPVLLRTRAREEGELQAERGRGAERRGLVVRRREGAARRAAADAGRRLQAGVCGTGAARGGQADPGPRAAVLAQPRDDRLRQTAPRRRAEGGRDEAARGAKAARATEAEDHRARDRVEDRAPAAEGRGGRRPGTAGHALGKARLTNREPARA